MKLLPSLKQRKRYIAFEIVSKVQFNVKDVQIVIQEAIKDFIGELGISKASPIFLKETFKDNKFIIKVNHTYTDEIRSALILITNIKKEAVIIKSITISGTIKKAKGGLL